MFKRDERRLILGLKIADSRAIIDRVLERGRLLLRLDGPSVRTLHVNLDDAMKEESDQQSELPENVGRNSGTHI